MLWFIKESEENYMHIKNIHSMIEKLSECAKVELDKGIEKIDTEEMSKAAEIIKELAEAEYYATITKAMEESEYGEDYDEEGPMDDGRRGYRGQPRSKTSGRYMSRGDGRRSNRGRRGYEEPWDEMYDEMEYYRDMDRSGMNRMYYSGGGSSSGGGSGMSGGSSGGSEGNRGGGNSRYENARRGYEEKKTMGADKQEKMKSLEEYMKTIAEELTQAVEGASPEERAMIKSKLNTVATKM